MGNRDSGPRGQQCGRREVSVVAGDLLIALGGGVVSFLSPCVLPLVPVYLSVTTGLGVTELERRRGPTAALRGATLFVAGFSVVFVVLGLSVTAASSLLLRNQVPIARIGGGVVVLLALGLFATTFGRGGSLQRDRRFHPAAGRWGLWSAPLVGAAFGFGWTPCIGPVLGSVLAVAAGEGSVGHGALLLTAYSAGLAVPFLACALAFHRGIAMVRWVGPGAVWVSRGAAVTLGGYGLLLALGALPWLTLHVQHAVSAVGLGSLVTLG
jgi:cytochrome c-type biogenesis protein